MLGHVFLEEELWVFVKQWKICPLCLHLAEFRDDTLKKEQSNYSREVKICHFEVVIWTSQGLNRAKLLQISSQQTLNQSDFRDYGRLPLR